MIKTIKIINRLKKASLIKDYAIGGGYAVNYYLEPILTYDLDVFIWLDTEKDFAVLYEYFRKKKYKIENVYVLIGGIPVQFLPTYINPLIEEGVRKGKRIRINGVPAKILKVEYLIATLLLAFRPKDRIIIPQLFKFADKRFLNDILKRFSDEKAPWDKRLGRILEGIQ
jgi:hypothetical protein